MSEKFTTRKGRVRRNVVALLSAVALGVGGVAVPQTAGAWVQQDIERNYGEKPDPVQETNAIFETFKPETMQSDGSYTYTIGGKAKAPKPLPDQNDPDYELKQRGASDILTMTVWVWAATPNTVLEEPAADDFKWASGQKRPFKSIEKVRTDDGVYTDQDGNKIGGGDGYKIEFDINAAEESFTAEIQAKLKADIPAGALVTAATYVETTISPRVIWEHENSWLTTDPNDSDTCAGIAHGRHRLQGGGYGQWMAEMYLGSLNGNLELRGAPRVTFTLPNGDTFSGEKSGMTQGDVSSPVLDANYKAGFEKLNPNTVWGQKFDWPFDKNTATGEFWLPTGTIFEFEQNVYDKDKPCSDAKWGGDKLHHRAMLTSANPPIVTADTAQTWFKMPEGEEPCDCELGSVGDKVWIDKNKDGIQDEDETQGVPGVKVVLKDASGKEVARTVTDEDGNWNINVKPGDYTVVYEPGDNVPSEPGQVSTKVTIKPGEKRDDIDLGILPSGSVGDRVWNDANGDGKQDEGEEGLENVVVLVSRDGEPTRSAVTDSNGDWKIEGLTPNAEYDIRFIQPDGWEVTGKVPGSDESGLVSKVTVKPNEYNDTYDLGLKKTDVTCDCEPEAPGTLGDRVWVDTNGNGKEDPDETEGVEGVTVIIRDKDGNEVIRTVTDEDGNWKVDVEPGEYTVEYKPGDRVPSKPGQVNTKITIKPGEKRDDIDLGILPSGSVGDRVWNDANGDGKQDEGEEGLENVVVLVSRDGEPTRSAVTDSNGDWKIEGLTPNAEYDIRFIQPDGWEVTGKVPGSDESGLVSKVTVKPNEYNDTYDLGLKKTDVTCDCEPEAPGTLGDKVWVDTNGNGKEDPDETEGVEGVTVIIRDKDGSEVIRTVTDEDGNWKVDVEPGEYTVEYKPGDRVPSKPGQVNTKITIKPGEKRDDIDLGILPSGSVGDRVWNDANGDGKQDEGEEGLENVVVLVSRDGEPTRSAVTDSNGDWKIEGLTPNAEYDIRFIQPDGWEVTGKVPGSDESGLVSKVTVKPNEYNDTYDLGLKKIETTCDCEPEAPGTLGDKVWVDTNGNGKEDPDETEGVEGVTVIIRDKDGNEVIRTVTDEDGNWKVDVEPGEYTVEYKTRDGYTPTDASQVSRKVVVESGKEYLDIDLGVKPGEKTPPTPPVTETVTETVPVPTPPVTETVTETVPVPTTKVEKPNGKTDNGAWERCVANAVASPLLYLVPIAVLGAVGGELARPYMGAINEQLAKVNADIQAAMRRDTPDRGHGGAGRDNDPFADIRAQLDAANRQIQAIGNDPNIQRFGTIALGVLGLVAAGGVLYDWCSNEKGEAFTSIKGGSSEPMPITTAPVTTTPEK